MCQKKENTYPNSQTLKETFYIKSVRILTQKKKKKKKKKKKQNSPKPSPWPPNYPPCFFRHSSLCWKTWRTGGEIDDFNSIYWLSILILYFPFEKAKGLTNRQTNSGFFGPKLRVGAVCINPALWQRGKHHRPSKPKHLFNDKP